MNDNPKQKIFDESVVKDCTLTSKQTEESSPKIQSIKPQSTIIQIGLFNNKFVLTFLICKEVL